MKRKDVILKQATIIVCTILITLFVKDMVDSNYYKNKISQIKQENIVLPTEKKGSVMIYDENEKCFKKYSGYMHFSQKVINNEKYIYINCDEAKMTSKMIFDWENMEEEQ